MNRLGKRGKANRQARELIAQYCESINLNRCEVRLPGCKIYMFLAPAHRHKRDWYNGDVELLADPKQWVCACVVCHDQMEVSRTLTEEVFTKLRP